MEAPVVENKVCNGWDFHLKRLVHNLRKITHRDKNRRNVISENASNAQQASLQAFIKCEFLYQFCTFGSYESISKDKLIQKVRSVFGEPPLSSEVIQEKSNISSQLKDINVYKPEQSSNSPRPESTPTINPPATTLYTASPSIVSLKSVSVTSVPQNQNSPVNTYPQNINHPAGQAPQTIQAVQQLGQNQNSPVSHTIRKDGCIQNRDNINGLNVREFKNNSIEIKKINVENNDYDFFVFTPVVYVDEHPEFLGFSKKKLDPNRGEIYPITFYKSMSDGGWRSSLFGGDHTVEKIIAKENARYEKGKLYSQETKIPYDVANSLDDCLATLSKNTVIKTKPDLYKQINNSNPQFFDPVKKLPLSEDKDFFNFKSIYLDYPYSDRREMNILVQERNFPTYEYSELKKNINLQFERVKTMRCVPDFKQQVPKRYTTNHTILDEIEVFVYEKQCINGTVLRWHLARSKQDPSAGWVHQVEIKEGEDSSISRSATFKRVVNLDLLALKPVEYRKQTPGFLINDNKVKNLEKTLPNNMQIQYYDITPLTSSIPPVKEFLESFKKTP